MTKTQNLYAEEIIVESPFYYDESGRLRVRVLEESAPMNPMMRKPDVQVPATKKGATPPVPEDDEETQTRKEYLAQKQPVIRDMRMRSPEERAFERERDKKRDEEDYQKFKQEKAAKKGVKPKPLPPLPAKGSDREAPPTNDRPRGPMDKSPIDPGMRNRLIVAKDKLRAVGAKPNLDSDEEQPTERPAVAVRKPFKSFRKAQKGPGRNVNTRAGLRGAKPSPKPVAKPMRGKPATRYMEEKIDLEKAEMGEVIKDFQKSDAPQFKGKSKAKRRMMAIAAKLQAERG